MELNPLCIFAKLSSFIKRKKLNEMFGMTVSRSQLSYWRKKINNPTFHSKSWGGARNFSFSQKTREKITQLLLEANEKDPSANLAEYQQILEKNGLVVSQMYIRRIFYSLKYTWKVPLRKIINKFSASNVFKYSEFLKWMMSLQTWTHVKYMDEVHFNLESKDFFEIFNLQF